LKTNQIEPEKSNKSKIQMGSSKTRQNKNKQKQMEKNPGKKLFLRQVT
jgi:hypothetical protein